MFFFKPKYWKVISKDNDGIGPYQIINISKNIKYPKDKNPICYSSRTEANSICDELNKIEKLQMKRKDYQNDVEEGNTISLHRTILKLEIKNSNLSNSRKKYLYDKIDRLETSNEFDDFVSNFIILNGE